MARKLLDRIPSVVRRDGRPAHAQIEQWLMDSIARGELATGDRLPGERDLAAALGVSRMTLRHALAELARRGVLVRVPGRAGGAFVAQPKIDCDLTGLAGFTEQMRRAHLRAGASVLRARTVPATSLVATALRTAPGAEVHEIVRVRSADGVALALERSFFPAEHFPDLLDHPLDGSLYRLLEQRYANQPHTATEFLESVTASAPDAAALGVEPGTALMRVERTTHSAAGLPGTTMYSAPIRQPTHTLGVSTSMPHAEAATISGARCPMWPREASAGSFLPRASGPPSMT